MKKEIVLVAFMSIVVNFGFAQKRTDSINTDTLDSLFKVNFRILDSAVDARKKDTSYCCCTMQIDFMESTTGIESKADGTFFGKLLFYKRDWTAWHKWYREHYQK
jgi:hypothetical protein